MYYYLSFLQSLTFLLCGYSYLIHILIDMVLQGRALLNAVGNLGLTGAYGEALNKLGHTLENVASQVEFPVFFHKGCFA